MSLSECDWLWGCRVSLEVLCVAVLVVALIAYAIFAGADFGGGFWTAFAFGPRRKQQQEAIFNAMGPVWETNHVWLILVLVTLWTTFPTVFAAIFVNLYLPLSVALVGIVFRGAAFAFRHYGEQSGSALPATFLVFSAASIITPIAMGVCVGAVAGGHLHMGVGDTSLFNAWLHPFPLVCGVIGLAISAFLTPFYMLARPLRALSNDFRLKAAAGALGLGAVTTLAIPVAAWDAPEFAGHLDEPLPIALLLAAATLEISSLGVLWRRLYFLAPVVAGATVIMVLAAWAAAQYPFIVLPNTRIEDTAAGDATLEAFLIALPAGAIILVPSLVWLFSLFATAPTEET
jgi:cytochrome bd ubiquinol oxidase subunit II